MESTTNRSTHNLALVLQEVLTAIERLRANPQTVSDADNFRNQMVASLRNAEQEGRQRGYSGDDMRLAIFAIVAFLDESVLNSRNAVFASWPRKPLQEELFGGHVAGETFFTNIDNLLRASDSASIADVLEVYLLCLLLGYQGRYTLGNRGELQTIKHRIAEKIQRIRGAREFSPGWAPVAGSVPRVQGDRVVRWLLYTAVSCAALCALMFLVFYFSLSSGVTSIRDLAAQAEAVRR
jgi:type VI secretion system protein ImpK